MIIDFLRKITLNKFKNLLKNRVIYAISIISKSGKINGMPVSLSIEPTAICQLHCPECVLGSKQLTRSNTLINFDLYKKIIDEAGDNYLKEYFKKVYENRSSNFANGRAVRNLFEEVITNQANRLANKSEITDDELNTLTYEDFLVDENE